MKPMTPKQQEVFQFIEKYQLENGSSPTIREMKEHLNVSSDNSVLKHLNGLVEKGYIEKDDTPRGIKLLDSIRHKLEAHTVNLPILGAIPAGGAVATEEHIDDWMTIDASRVKNPKNSFMLRVTGDSMIDAGIFEGDLLIADSKKQPRVGDIVIGLVDGGNTVKRYVKKDNQFYLQAENAEYPDIHPVNQLEVQGVVTGLVRTY